MSLDPQYLVYPHRRRGMDHDLYPWTNMFERPPVRWPGGATVAVCLVIDLEWFPIVPGEGPVRAPGHMQTPYPDYRHYTARDYGSRVGAYRLLEALGRAGVKASVAANAAIGERYPALLQDFVAAGHEVIAHSTDMNGIIATGLSEDAERNLIRRSLDSLEAVTGARPRGWRSVARSQSWNTPRLLAEAGVEYMCDWVNDELPFYVSTPAGRLINLPLNHEFDDRQILNVQQQSVQSYAEQIRDATILLEGEAAHFGGRMLPLVLTPYIMGLPYRIAAFEALLEWLAARPGLWFSSCHETVDAWRASQDQAAADVDDRMPGA